MTTLETIKTDAVLDVPPTVRLCPYCGGKLYVQFSSWTEDDDGLWMAESVELECETQPELDENDPTSLEAWDEWFAVHSEMPYVYWLPATLAVEKWVNDNYRFR